MLQKFIMALHYFTFVYADKEYAAQFEKIQSHPVQYKMYNVEPPDFSKTMDLTFFADKANQVITWAGINPIISDKERSFKTATADGIFNKCARENILVFA